MLEELFSLIKEQGTDTVITNPVVPNDQNNAVIADATHSVASELQGVLAGGGLQNVLSLFSNGANNTGGSSLLNNPIVSNIISNFTNKLTANHGIAPDQASGIANNLIPGVLSNLINKTNDPNNGSFDIASVIGSLTGGASESASDSLNIVSLISKFTDGSLDANNDGHVGLDDIISKVSGGAKQQQDQNGGSGLMDAIKRFI